jgi:hypothetical protein
MTAVEMLDGAVGDHEGGETLAQVSSARIEAPISASHKISICSPWASSAMQKSRAVTSPGSVSSTASTSHGRPRASTKIPCSIGPLKTPPICG